MFFNTNLYFPAIGTIYDSGTLRVKFFQVWPEKAGQSSGGIDGNTISTNGKNLLARNKEMVAYDDMFITYAYYTGSGSCATAGINYPSYPIYQYEYEYNYNFSENINLGSIYDKKTVKWNEYDSTTGETKSYECDLVFTTENSLEMIYGTPHYTGESIINIDKKIEIPYDYQLPINNVTT